MMDAAKFCSYNLQMYKSTSSSKGQSVSKKDYHCFLEELLLKEEFDYLAILLNDTIWQRFSVLPLELPLAETSRAESIVYPLNCQETQISLSKFACLHSNDPLWDKEMYLYMLNTFLSEELKVADESNQEMVSMGMTSSQDNSGKLENMISTDILLTPWFVMSAVFTGCSKLLNFLLSACEKNRNKKYINTQESVGASEGKFCDTNFSLCSIENGDGASKFSSASTAIFGSKSISAATPVLNSKSVSANTPILDVNNKHLQLVNSDLNLPYLSDTQRGHKLQPYFKTVQELVNGRMACDFPITDTWIHQSVKLIVSPLHLACWRHDFSSISLLLLHGADPNNLALEQVPDELMNELIYTYSNDVHSIEQRYFKLSNDLYFYRDKGLTPLHFFALGLRSPPRHSVLGGCKSGIMHDTCAFFQDVKKNEYVGSNDGEDMSGNGVLTPSSFKAILSTACVMLNPSGQCRLDEKYEIIAKCELVVNCLKVLLQAGANPNMGQSILLNEAYPLDIIIQPPTKVYYAPSAARGNQSSVSLRLQDLEMVSAQVVAASDILLSHNAKLSSKFLSMYLWRPAFLDCFHLNDSHKCYQLVSFLVRLGVFSEKISRNNKSHLEAGSCAVSPATTSFLHYLIADIMNASISEVLTKLILNWCSVSLLHDLMKALAKIGEMSGWNVKLRKFYNMVVYLQLRSLKHGCFYVILSTIEYSTTAIWSLPLPNLLKRELTELCF